MGINEISKSYYTSAEAQKKLGMTRDAFNHYVKSGQIKKTMILGKHGFFAKRDIDSMALSIQAAILAAQTPDIDFRKATLRELPREIELAVLNYGEKTNAFNENRKELLLANPEMSYYVYDNGQVVASINITPLSPEGIEKFKRGERGWLLGEYVLPFKPGKQEIIIIDMLTTTLVPANRRNQYAMHLLFGLAKAFELWGKQGIEITRVYANGGTPQGRRILETARFNSLGEVRPGRIIYELDMAASDIHLIKPYKEAIGNWKLLTDVG